MCSDKQTLCNILNWSKSAEPDLRVIVTVVWANVLFIICLFGNENEIGMLLLYALRYCCSFRAVIYFYVRCVWASSPIVVQYNGNIIEGWVREFSATTCSRNSVISTLFMASSAYQMMGFVVPCCRLQALHVYYYEVCFCSAALNMVWYFPTLTGAGSFVSRGIGFFILQDVLVITDTFHF